MKFSVVVPIYNVEKYLVECVDSVLLQSYEDFEVILVDDGSQDGCGHICDEYANKDKRVKVIHKVNGGLSDARNCGMDVAKGEYIVFLDSDDKLIAEALESIVDKLSSAPDVLITEMLNLEDISQSVENRELFVAPENTGKVQSLSFVFKEAKYTWPAQQYVVKREFLLANSLRFDVGYYHEDVSWTTRLFAQASSFMYYTGIWYLRRIGREGSITNVVKSKRTMDAITLITNEVHSDLYDKLTDGGKKIVFNRLILSLFSTISFCRYYSDEDICQIAELLERNKDVFQYTIKMRHKVFVGVMNIFGAKTALRLVSKLYR